MKRIKNVNGFVCLDIVISFLVILVVMFQLISKVTYIVINYFCNKSRLKREEDTQHVL